jgi:hypothetical protein
MLRDWLATWTQVDARKGGRLWLWWDDGDYAAGEYTIVTPGRKVAFTWRGAGDPEPSLVTVALVSLGGGTQVTLRHTGLGAGRKWAPIREALARRWPEALENLQTVLDSGVDLRLARRPFFGLTGGDPLTPQIAAQHGVPAKEGFWLGGLGEDMPAARAGLRPNDVLVSLGGRRLRDWPDLAAALGAHRAGDRVRAVFWRGAEKRTVIVELGRRPAELLPETAEALLAAARANYAQVNRQLADLVAGVSHAEAGRCPADQEWNILELLAHYVATERDLQSWIAAMLRDGNHQGELDDSLQFRPNVTPRLDALVARYPSVPALLAELDAAQNETLALIAALPADFVARRHYFRRVAGWLAEVVPGHVDEHRDQFAATLQAARSAPAAA